MKQEISSTSSILLFSHLHLQSKDPTWATFPPNPLTAQVTTITPPPSYASVTSSVTTKTTKTTKTTQTETTRDSGFASIKY
jgi:hypothetical protein